MTGSAQVVNSILTALQNKSKGTENGAERQKGISGDLWMYPSSSGFSGHALFMFFDYIIDHTHIWKCLLQTEITDRGENVFFFCTFGAIIGIKIIVIHRTQ